MKLDFMSNTLFEDKDINAKMNYISINSHDIHLEMKA